MKKVITYTEDQVKQIVGLLNCVTVTGIQNSKQIAAVAQILDSGTPGEIGEPDKKETSSKEFVPHNWKTVPVKAENACNSTNNAMPSEGKG